MALLALRILDEAAGVDYRPSSIRDAIAFLRDLEGLHEAPPPHDSRSVWELAGELESMRTRVSWLFRDARSGRARKALLRVYDVLGEELAR